MLDFIAAGGWFFITFFYIRVFGRLLRKRIQLRSPRLGMPEVVILKAAFTVCPALALLYVRHELGWVWISKAGIWASVSLDVLLSLCLIPYFVAIRRLRHSPAAVRGTVTVDPGFHNAIFTFNLWMSLFIRTGTITIAQADAKRFLRGDKRFFDIVARENKLSEIWNQMKQTYSEGQPDLDSPGIALDAADLESRSMPQIVINDIDFGVLVQEGHLGTTDRAIKDRSPRLFERLTRSKTAGATESHALNRLLNCGLSDELWEASCNLCKMTPGIVAGSWKRFHFQETLRLRLLVLFNTSDLLQRLIGAIVICKLRDSGELSEMENPDSLKLPPLASGRWNRCLRWALEKSKSADLEVLRGLLLHPRDDFADLANWLKPFEALLGTGHLLNDGNDTLRAWAALAEVRNKVIGHGGIGRQMQLDPQSYLVPLHHYFLAVVKRIAALDLQVLSALGYPNVEIAGKDQGLYVTGKLPAHSEAVAFVPATRELVVLSPYFKFNKERLLVFNRYSQNDGSRQRDFEYIDFYASSISHPSFIRVPVPLDYGSFFQIKFPEPVCIRVPLSERRIYKSPDILLRKAVALADTAPREALPYFDDVIALYERGGKSASQAEALVEKAKALQSLDRLKEARECYDGLIDLRQKLISEGEDLMALQAAALTVRGDILAKLKEFEAALSSSDEAADLWRRLIAQEQSDTENLVCALLTKALALRSLNRFEEAVACYAEIIGVRGPAIADGRSELIRYQAVVLIEQGDVFRKLKRFEEGLGCYEQALAMRRDLLESEQVDGESVVNVLLRKIKTCRSLGRLAEALSCYEEVIAIRNVLIAGGREDLLGYHAVVWINKGRLLSELGRDEEALPCYEQALTVRRMLLESGNCDGEKVVEALLDKIEALKRLDQLLAVLDCYDEALDIMLGFIHAGRDDLHPNTIDMLLDRARILRQLSRTDEALEAYDKAIQIGRNTVLSSLEESGNDGPERERFARLISAKTNALVEIRRLGDAAECLETATRCYEWFHDSIGIHELTERLGGVLDKRVEHLVAKRWLTDALTCLEQVIELRKSVFERDHSLSTCQRLTYSLLRRGDILRGIGDNRGALDSFDGAIAVANSFHNDEGDRYIVEYIGYAFAKKAHLLPKVGCLTDAVTCADEAIQRFSQLLGGNADDNCITKLALSLMDKGIALQRMDDFAAAIECYDEVVSCFAALGESLDIDCTRDLATAFVNKGESLMCLGQLDEAAECYATAIIKLSQLAQDGFPNFPNELTIALIDQGFTLRHSGNVEQALLSFDQAIDLQENRYNAGRNYRQSLHVEAIGNRLITLLELRRLDLATRDILRGTELLAPFAAASGTSAPISRLWGGFLNALKSLSNEDVAEILSGIGDHAALVQEMRRES
ncbi:MAG TPA: tetratricopeptide repeat protein [Blastocatellia bacterium]|nr:tetratricopeptide repeat protein [Blastocatellia bacterium]